MTNEQINIAVAKCFWKPKHKGWVRYYSYGYEWHNELPVEDYCSDLRLALELLESHPDYKVKRYNGTFYEVEFYTPSYEYIGEEKTLAMAIALAYIKLHEKEKIK